MLGLRKAFAPLRTRFSKALILSMESPTHMEKNLLARTAFGGRRCQNDAAEDWALESCANVDSKGTSADPFFVALFADAIPAKSFTMNDYKPTRCGPDV